jgi:ABC-type branched-subunit amino acid transport system ATPase component
MIACVAEALDDAHRARRRRAGGRDLGRPKAEVAASLRGEPARFTAARRGAVARTVLEAWVEGTWVRRLTRLRPLRAMLRRATVGANAASEIEARPRVTDRPPVLEARDVTKTFGAFTAVDRVSLSLRAGEKHALLGENGAGKSTLVKMIYGVLAPSAGGFLWEGRPVAIAAPGGGARAGHRHGVPAFLGVRRAERGRECGAGAAARADAGALGAHRRGLAAYGLSLDPGRAMHTLSVGEKQRVEIVRALLQDPKLLILDEPTSVLTPQEAEALFDVLDRLAAEGRAILYISHRLEEVRRLCEAATILRRGKVVARSTRGPRARARSPR